MVGRLPGDHQPVLRGSLHLRNVPQNVQSRLSGQKMHNVILKIVNILKTLLHIYLDEFHLTRCAHINCGIMREKKLFH